jgi:riboflavin synthase alpha subunit
VNLEMDIVAKYLEKWMCPAPRAELQIEELARQGF